MSVKWVSIEGELPNHFPSVGSSFLWVWGPSLKVSGCDEVLTEPQLGFNCGDGVRIQTAESAGDREGLNVEYFHGVTKWAYLETPESPNG